MDIDHDPNYGGDVTPGGNPAQDQPGFNQDAAADMYPSRDTTGGSRDPAYNPGVDQDMDQDPAYNPGVDQGLNQDPAYGAGMDQDAGTGGGAGSTGYDPNAGANHPGGGGGVGDAMQRARGKVEEALGNMTNNPDLQQQGISRQAGGQPGYDTPDTGTMDPTGTADTTNQDLADDMYGNP